MSMPIYVLYTPDAAAYRETVSRLLATVSDGVASEILTWRQVRNLELILGLNKVPDKSMSRKTAGTKVSRDQLQYQLSRRPATQLWRVLDLSADEAYRMKHDYVGSEHMLAAILRFSQGVVARVLRELGVDLNRVQSGTEVVRPRGTVPVPKELGLTPRSMQILKLASEEAERMNSHHIHTEHLLLAIVYEGNSIAAATLESLGISLDRVRALVIRELSRRRRRSAA
jgi:hypothetical protein